MKPKTLLGGSTACLVAVGIAATAWAYAAGIVNVSSLNTTDLIAVVPLGNAAVNNVYMTTNQLRSFIFGLGASHNTTPTLTTGSSGCGGTGAAVVGTDYAGVITEASSSTTSCVLTFGTAYASAPSCVAVLNNATDAAFKLQSATTGITFTQTSAGSQVINYICAALPGG